jgi:TctA family transporter
LNILIESHQGEQSGITCLLQVAAGFGRYSLVLLLYSMGLYIVVNVLGRVSLNEIAFKFGPAEYFSLIVFHLIFVVVLAAESVLKEVGMVLLGLGLGLVGTDINSGTPRFSFDWPELLDGLDAIVIFLGLFGLGSVLFSLRGQSRELNVFSAGKKGLLIKIKIYKRVEVWVLRGLGVFLGVMPYRWLTLVIVLFCAISVYSITDSLFGILVLVVFGFVGYFLIYLGLNPAPLLLGLIASPMMEENLRRALLLSRGDWSVFVTRGLSASLLFVAAVLLAIVLLPSVSKKREEAFVED